MGRRRSLSDSWNETPHEQGTNKHKVKQKKENVCMKNKRSPDLLGEGPVSVGCMNTIKWTWVLLGFNEQT